VLLEPSPILKAQVRGLALIAQPVSTAPELSLSNLLLTRDQLALSDPKSALLVTIVKQDASLLRCALKVHLEV